MAFKMRSQSAVKKGGFKNMGSSPNKFLGRIARGLKNTRVGQAFGKVAGSGALGLGGMMASQMMGGGRQGMQGAGSAPAQGLSPHTHDDSGEATPLNKTKHKASNTVDFPVPLVPTTRVVPSLSNSISVHLSPVERRQRAAVS